MLIPIVIFGAMGMAFLCYAAGKKNKALRDALAGLAGAAAFAGCLAATLRGEAFSLPGVCGLGMHFRADGFRGLYACIAAFMWMMTGCFSPVYFRHYHRRNRYYFFNLVTLGATLGVFLSDDLYTTLIFFEIMSFSSYPMVVQEETKGAMRAGQTYIAVAVIGGLTTLMGLFLLWRELGTLSFESMRAALSSGNADMGRITAAAWCTMVGFAAKAGLFPLHIWLPKAHPVAPAPASALLSGILTKSGVFGMIAVCANLTAGNEGFGSLLFLLAVITMFTGAVLALLSVDMKRMLACSSMSQIGFITVGLSLAVLLGEEGSLAAYGALCHMVNHSLIKLTLFMAAGAVYMNLHRLNLNDIRGYGRKKPLLHFTFLMGALSIGCIPPIGSGYASKSLLHEALLEYIAHLQGHGGPWQIYKGAEILFLISGGLTIAYMTKLYICLFLEKHPERQAEFDRMEALPGISRWVLPASALVLPVMALFPNQTLQQGAAIAMPFFGQETIGHPIAFFSGENLLGAAESMAIGAAVYLLIVRRLLMKEENGVRVYVNRLPEALDLERLYRALLAFLVKALGTAVGFLAGMAEWRLIREWIPAGVTAVTRFFAGLPESRLVQKGIPAAVTAVTRFAAEATDMLALILRRTVFRWKKARRQVPVGNRLIWYAGGWLNQLTRSRGRKKRRDYREVLAMDAAALNRRSERILGSVSYGLLLLAFGLLVTLVYLLVQ